MSNSSAASQSDVETQPLVDVEQSLDTRGTMQGVPGSGREKAEMAIWMVVWMLVSAVVVIYNKWVFTAGGFPYPLALTSMHMIACFVVFGSIRKFAPQDIRLAIMPDADVEMSWPAYFKNYVSISFFYAGTLGTGNLAYLFSSVPFIQMMKPMNCVFASLACFACGVESPTWSHMIIVCVIALGVVTATHHDGQFSMTGCLLQMCSSISEGCRLGLMQMATTKGLKLDPVSTVYNFSFASAVLLSCATFKLEWPLDFSRLISPWVLVINCILAILLNVIVATVIKKTSAVIFTLSGIVKDIMLIVASSFVFSTTITITMLFGYLISVVGLMMFKAYKDNMKVFQEHGFLSGMSFAIQSAKQKS